MRQNGEIRMLGRRLASGAAICALVPSVVLGFGLSRAQPDSPAAQASQEARESSSRHFGRLEATPKPAGAVRVASYNVLNLFDDVDDPAITGDIDDATMTKPLSEREALARAIRAINPDILALEEVESEAAVRWFLDEQLKDMGYTHIVSIDAGDGRGIENAVVSRFPIVETSIWPGEDLGGVHPPNWGRGENYEAGKPIKFRRSPLRVTVDVPAAEGDADGSYRLTLYVVHHKSGGPGGYWREAEATKVIEFIHKSEALDPDANIVVLGDFNCEPGNEAHRLYTQAGLIDAFAARKEGDSEWVTHESGRSIDHMLINRAVSGEIVPGSSFVYGTPCRPPASDWRRTPTPGGFASDHFPIAIDLIPADKPATP